MLLCLDPCQVMLCYLDSARDELPQARQTVRQTPCAAGLRDKAIIRWQPVVSQDSRLVTLENHLDPLLHIVLHLLLYSFALSRKCTRVTDLREVDEWQNFGDAHVQQLDQDQALL